MRVFIYEWVTAGGPGGQTVPEGWTTEGRAMRRVSAAEFQAVPGVSVVAAVAGSESADEPHPVHRLDAREGIEGVLRAAGSCDLSLLIAPESVDCLATLIDAFADRGLKTLNCGASAVRLTGDKRRLGRHLAGAGVRVPKTFEGRPAGSAYPLVVKPNDGAGSAQTYLVSSPDRWPAGVAPSPDWLVQSFVPGTPSSASYLVDENGEPHLLAVGVQRMAVVDGQFAYRGGTLPADRGLGVGESLRAVRSVRGLRGFVGVDFIKGDRETTVLEINPRLTTSFVGLTRLVPPGTIAGAWLSMALGETISPSFDALWEKARSRKVEFQADGSCSVRDGAG